MHAWNEARIVEKLKSFDIDARIVGRNAGPVVTQYEVQPAPHVKVSRIEALADDLAMALAARSLRIEAPIPGKSAVGIEVPNKDFNVVSLRGILEAVDFGATGSKLTFALGRDVAGRVPDALAGRAAQLGAGHVQLQHDGGFHPPSVALDGVQNRPGRAGGRAQPDDLLAALALAGEQARPQDARQVARGGGVAEQQGSPS